MDLLKFCQKTDGVLKTSLFKRILIGSVILLVLLFGTAIAIGYTLPRVFKVERSMETLAPAEKVYRYLEDPRAWEKWTIWTRREPEMKIVYTGPEKGVGAKWSWKSEILGSVDMVMTKAEAFTVIEYKQTFEDAALISTGTLKLVPAGSGTRVIWTSEGDIGSNPLARYLAMLVDTMLGRDFEGGLMNLKMLAEG